MSHGQWSSKGSSHDGNSNSTRTIQTSLLLNWIILDFGHDAVFALAMAVEKIGYTSSELQKRNLTCSFDLTDPRTVSQHGPELSYGLSLTRFKGIAGDFSLVDRQRQSSTFRIVNINGGGARTIGFWTPQNGLVNILNSSSSFSSNVLGPVIWPGDSLSVPKGWEVPTPDRR
ncbi:glutamate receptor 2.2-like [Prunus yedoensis var. nudiflora]|uniref:Glutamate receptor 2.2-like n=1 Tax=Prunus yedoensis var. nudiflora TaxID=2094558 RepID=A0A314XZ01_PRUYE|nr:glutamate receptor 2.2-like [Prunus yedoensis var. nudiflora]